MTTSEQQRAPTREEMGVVGNDIEVAVVAHARAFALLQGAADRAMDDSGHDAEASDLLKLTDATYNALIIAIAKRVREGEEEVAADATRWRTFTTGAVVGVDEDGGLYIGAALTDDWENEPYLTSTDRKILSGRDMKRWSVRGKRNLDRIIDAACEIRHADPEAPHA